MKIATILGARPQFVKAAMLSMEWTKHPEIQECIIHTGQHFDENMSKVFFEEMNIPKPKYNLNINGLGHAAMTGMMMIEIEKVLLLEKPDWVVVFGDTNSTLAGALVAKKLGIKIAHIEAGLRSYNMEMPEEINRVLVDRISDLLCCPTDLSLNNLEKEGFSKLNSKVVLTGDIMFDAVLHFRNLALEKSKILEKQELAAGQYILATIHREGNTAKWENFKEIIEALEEINKIQKVVLVAHPRTKKLMEENNWNSTLKIIEPLGYFDMLSLVGSSNFILSDSGGLQKEAYWLKKSCLIIREETEWMELVDNGNNILAGVKRKSILEASKKLSGQKTNFDIPFYGRGETAKMVATEIALSIGFK